MVGDGDRPEPLIARGREQHLDRRGAVRRVVGVHVQVDVDLRPGRDHAAHRAVRRRLVALRGQRRVHGLELLGEAVEAQAVAHALARSGQRGAQRRVADEARELGGEHVDVARLEEQAALALADELLVDRQPRRDGDDPGADRGEQDMRCRGSAVGGRDDDVRGAQHAREPGAAAAQDAHARPHVRAQRRDGRGAAVGQERDPPRQRRVQAAQRAQREAQRTALLLVGHDDVHALVLGVGARPDLDAGAHDAVLGGEGLREELRRGLVAGQAGVEAAEDELDDAARELRGDDPLGRRDVERADVQRARVAQRGARGRRGERLVHVADVERDDLVHRLDGPRDVDRERRGAPRRGDLRQHLADREHPRRPARLGQERQRIGAQRLARRADGLVPSRGGDDEHPVPARGEGLGGAADLTVDLPLRVLPGTRRDVCDREGPRHRREDRARGRPGP